MMTNLEIIAIILIHWIADFVFQTDKQAKGKSKNLRILLSHTFSYSLFFWFFIFAISNNLFFAFYFWIITLFCHTFTDYFTSKINAKLWENGKTHEFFVCVGFDQSLHYIQLFLTYSLLN